MKITSPMFEDGAPIPTQYTCDGEDINPPLIILDAPDGVKSFALVVDDPDAPGKVWTHWVLFNILPGTHEIGENSVPSEAIQGVNDFGNSEYGGACPPPGQIHTYHFKLYALDEKLRLPHGSSKEYLEQAMVDHLLSSTELTGTYQRS